MGQFITQTKFGSLLAPMIKEKLARCKDMNIKKAAEKLDLTPDTIRYYEHIGLIPPLTCDKNGIRTFPENDMQTLNFVKYMRKAGLSIESLRDYMYYVYEDNDETVEERKQILRDGALKIKTRINELQDTLDYLQYKIDNYDNFFPKKN